MPYVFREELADGEEAADVVERADYSQLEMSLATVTGERDKAIARAEEAEGEAARMKDKYAKRFLTTASAAKKELEEDVKRDTGPRTFKELFAERENQ